MYLSLSFTKFKLYLLKSEVFYLLIFFSICQCQNVFNKTDFFIFVFAFNFIDERI